MRVIAVVVGVDQGADGLAGDAADGRQVIASTPLSGGGVN